MTETENLVLDHLHAIRAGLADLKADMREVKERLGILEHQYASLSGWLDRAAADIERIRNRLELAGT